MDGLKISGISYNSKQEDASTYILNTRGFDHRFTEKVKELFES